MLMKKISIILFSVIFIFLSFTTAAYAVEINAASAILIDAASGKVLFSKNSDESVAVASTTKVLTCLLALENLDDLSETITLPDDFVNVGESGIYLTAGETHTYEDLLYAMMLRSANDAAQALAIAVSGSEEEFVKLMNERTAEMGLKESSWANPHGLDNENHYSSAHDLAMITMEAMKIPEFNTIVSTYTWTLPWEGNDYDRVVYNHNQFLSTYEGADGVKTGYTAKSGNCLVASATRDGMRLISVVLNSTDHYGDTTTLMDYGFENYSLRKVANKGKVVASVKVNSGRNKTVDAILADDVYMVMENDSRYSPDGVVSLPDSLDAPIRADQIIGKISYNDGEGNTIKIDLYPAVDMEVYTFGGVFLEAWQRIWRVFF